ncbi:TetR/AcrR family transcriptional regulator [Pseudomonas hefeiensis]|jgi:AcrR family transcriptional regulator|uniref:TetR/AcrR family transcriptional regulator n=1 Tax=Pseudomonas hefeiensis TaxID=2738125 RepID=A0ABY9G5B1_9PSED|nr:MULTISPECIES: TetR/AcrR family transcriptional regulator [unclassified Pseudomonas]WLH10820.1 TetR/AcrR family transcriptional regulator [Pseudomonas sp. FP205]WLH93902.1 TetR/AcrR family transcriptional regulator [Pseudomonas sp. FP53]WLI38176.1 TetR/AcrR family transcriptional regulator [Pseudomonas sp. FP821]
MQVKKTSMPTGRPRSEATRRLILDAAISLLQDKSIQAISIEAIAREAGVSKATIYRWWESKASVVIDAFIEQHLVKTTLPRGMRPREAITHHFRSFVTQYSGWPGRLVAQIVAEGQSDPTIHRVFRERFHYGRRAVVREMLEEWKKSGDISKGADVEVLMDLIYGPVYMRLMIGHAPLDESFAESHINYICALLGSRS